MGDKKKMTLSELRDYNTLCGLLSDHPIRKTLKELYDPLKKVIVFIPCRNEEEHLSNVLDHVMNQTEPFFKVIVINDGSTDNTKNIALDYDVILIDLPEKHPSYVGKPELAKIYNNAFRYIDHNYNCDYIVQLGADTLIPLNYNEEMLKRLKKDKKIVISGGIIEGEKQYDTFVRGSGRYYNSDFWYRYIGRYPLNYTWESYPIYLARSIGFKIKWFPDLIMRTLRQTTFYIPEYGYAMRELGYFPPYAIIRCLFVFFFNSKVGYQMLMSYLRSPYSSRYICIKNYLRLHQVNVMIKPLVSLKIWLSRL